MLGSQISCRAQEFFRYNHQITIHDISVAQLETDKSGTRICRLQRHYE